MSGQQHTPAALYPRERPGTYFQEAGWAPGPVWKGGKSRPHRDSIPDRPARSQSLYRLSYRAHKAKEIDSKITHSSFKPFTHEFSGRVPLWHIGRRRRMMRIVNRNDEKGCNIVKEETTENYTWYVLVQNSSFFFFLILLFICTNNIQRLGLTWNLGICLIHMVINLLKPTGHVMHQQFNIQQLYALPTLYLCVLYLSENKQRLVPLTA